MGSEMCIRDSVNDDSEYNVYTVSYKRKLNIKKISRLRIVLTSGAICNNLDDFSRHKIPLFHRRTEKLIK